jgi:hypothetical protein
MNPPTKTEWVVLIVLTIIYAFMNVNKHGWSGLFMNTTPLGYMVAAWVWCLAFHRK